VIKAYLDPHIVDAMQSVRALEEGIVMDDEDQYKDEVDKQEADVQPDPKRTRLKTVAPIRRHHRQILLHY